MLNKQKSSFPIITGLTEYLISFLDYESVINMIKADKKLIGSPEMILRRRNLPAESRLQFIEYCLNECNILSSKSLSFLLLVCNAHNHTLTPFAYCIIFERFIKSGLNAEADELFQNLMRASTHPNALFREIALKIIYNIYTKLTDAQIHSVLTDILPLARSDNSKTVKIYAGKIEKLTFTVKDIPSVSTDNEENKISYVNEKFSRHSNKYFDNINTLCKKTKLNTEQIDSILDNLFKLSKYGKGNPFIPEKRKKSIRVSSIKSIVCICETQSLTSTQADRILYVIIPILLLIKFNPYYETKDSRKLYKQQQILLKIFEISVDNLPLDKFGILLNKVIMLSYGKDTRTSACEMLIRMSSRRGLTIDLINKLFNIVDSSYERRIVEPARQIFANLCNNKFHTNIVIQLFKDILLLYTNLYPPHGGGGFIFEIGAASYACDAMRNLCANMNSEQLQIILSKCIESRSTFNQNFFLMVIANICIFHKLTKIQIDEILAIVLPACDNIANAINHNALQVIASICTQELIPEQINIIIPYCYSNILNFSPSIQRIALDSASSLNSSVTFDIDDISSNMLIQFPYSKLMETCKEPSARIKPNF